MQNPTKCRTGKKTDSLIPISQKGLIYFYIKIILFDVRFENQMIKVVDLLYKTDLQTIETYMDVCIHVQITIFAQNLRNNGRKKSRSRRQKWRWETYI